MATAARSPLSAQPPSRVCRTANQQPLTAGQVARTLQDLIQLGFVEQFRDEHNVTRYRARLVAAPREVA